MGANEWELEILCLQKQELRCGTQVQLGKVSVDLISVVIPLPLRCVLGSTDPLTGIIQERINVGGDPFDVAVNCELSCSVNELPMSVSACEQLHCHHTARSRSLHVMVDWSYCSSDGPEATLVHTELVKGPNMSNWQI